MIDLKSIIDTELRKRLTEAKAAGYEYLDVISGDLHKQLGFKNRMPSCCHAMRRMMKPMDVILYSPPKGKGSTFNVRYFL